jgi:hypothetical protein
MISILSHWRCVKNFFLSLCAFGLMFLIALPVQAQLDLNGEFTTLSEYRLPGDLSFELRVRADFETPSNRTVSLGTGLYLGTRIDGGWFREDVGVVLAAQIDLARSQLVSNIRIREKGLDGTIGFRDSQRWPTFPWGFGLCYWTEYRRYSHVGPYAEIRSRLARGALEIGVIVALGAPTTNEEQMQGQIGVNVTLYIHPREN